MKHWKRSESYMGQFLDFSMIMPTSYHKRDRLKLLDKLNPKVMGWPSYSLKPNRIGIAMGYIRK